MKKNTAAFIKNPGPNQVRKMVPVMSKQQSLTTLANKVVNARNKADALNVIATHLAPVVMPMVDDNIPQSYRIIKEIYNNRQNIKQGVDTVRENVSKIFPGKQAALTASPGYGLSKAPNPRKVLLNSGIVPNTYTQDYMFAVTGVCDPMHISCIELQIPTSPTNPLYAYFNNTIAFDIQTRAQSNIGFDIGVNTVFTAANILTAMNAAIQALQYHYWFSSICAYESDPRNKNEGMIALRQTISAQQMSLIVQLGKRIEDTPIPPRIVEYVKYMSANYYSGDSQGSAVIKTCPNSTLLNTTDATAIANLTAVLNGLSSTQNNAVFALMRRAIPQWRVGKLYDVTVTPNYDLNFETIFSNLPFIVWNGTANVSYPPTADSNATISYNSFTNKLDGLAFASCSAYDSFNNVYVPGIVGVKAASQGTGATNVSTRFSWQRTGGITKFYPSDFDAFNTASRQDTYQIGGATVATITSPHLYGSDKCQNVNQNALLQSAYRSLDFLFNVNSIPVKGVLSAFNAKARNNIIPYN